MIFDRKRDRKVNKISFKRIFGGSFLSRAYCDAIITNFVQFSVAIVKVGKISKQNVQNTHKLHPVISAYQLYTKYYLNSITCKNTMTSFFLTSILPQAEFTLADVRALFIHLSCH